MTTQLLLPVLNQHEIDTQVAERTGEDFCTIRQRGFSPLIHDNPVATVYHGQCRVCDYSEESTEPAKECPVCDEQTMDWIPGGEF